MYKIVPITALTTADSFISSDKVIEISQDRTKMSIGENDYEHKNKFYLSSCIDNADRSLNTYLSAYDNLSNTYITSSLSDVYITNGNLITRKLIDTILSTDAFLTKDGCKTIEEECISYIAELKNKAVSTIMAKLNESFIKQNSVKRPIYGQLTQDNQPYDYVSKILTTENYPDLSSHYNFNFEKGEFTLANLMFGNSLGGAQDVNQSASFIKFDLFAKHYVEQQKSYFMNESYDSANDIIKDIIDENERLVFNAENTKNYNYKIIVPSASFDYLKNKTIPIAKLLTYVLKNQIYRVLTNICNNYASLMISVPNYPEYSPEKP